ncbi:MAG: hypothetical protein Q4D61_03165 [Cardiobacteriaceae bacterium]|nr:hypothetical protein [Cardiobacteriaceae bacterium]
MKNPLLIMVSALLLAACTGYRPVSEKALNVDKNRPAACSITQADAADGGKRREYLRCSVQVVLDSPEARQVLGQNLPLRSGGEVVKGGARLRASANANGNTDETTCRNAFIHGLRKFQRHVRKQGGSGVANVRMTADGAGAGEFECVVGTVRGTVTAYVDIVR